MNLEPQQRAHSPQLAAGLASEYKIRFKVLTVEDSLQLAAGFFKMIFRHGENKIAPLHEEGPNRAVMMEDAMKDWQSKERVKGFKDDLKGIIQSVLLQLNT